MIRTARIGLCCIIVLSLAIPVFAGGAPDARSAASKAAGSVYKGGATVLDRTEGFFTGALKNTFSIFNPCLDLVKGCTKVVLYPIEKPISYAENVIYKSRGAKKAAHIPAPQKPELPK